MPSNLDVQDFASIVHVTTGEDCCSVGSRIPAVWYHPRGDLHITTGSDGNGNYIQNFAAPPVAIGQWTKIQISQELEDQMYKYKIFIDDEKKLDAVNSQPTEFQNVKVYAADPWWDSQPRSVRNLIISVKELAK